MLTAQTQKLSTLNKSNFAFSTSLWLWKNILRWILPDTYYTSLLTSNLLQHNCDLLYTTLPPPYHAGQEGNRGGSQSLLFSLVLGSHKQRKKKLGYSEPCVRMYTYLPLKFRSEMSLFQAYYLMREVVTESAWTFLNSFGNLARWPVVGYW